MAVTFLTNEDKVILDEQINKNAEDISTLSKEIENLNADGLGALTDAQVQACKSFANLFAETTGDVDSFLFFTDPHFTNSTDVTSNFQKMLDEIAAVYNNTPTSMCICGGDWLNNGNTKYNASWILGKIDGAMKQRFDEYVLIVGNHDTNYQGYEWVQSGYNRSECEKCQLTTVSIRNLWHREQDASYFTVDGDSAKFYVFDTGLDWYPDMDEYKWTQIDWFANSLLTDKPERCAVMMHIVTNSSNEATPFVDAVTQVASAYNNKATVTLNDKTYDFTSSDGLIGFVIGGHNHDDLTYRVNDIAVITTKNTLAVTNKATFDLVMVDWAAEKVKLVRVGGGENRTVPFTQNSETSYTNLADPTSADWENNKDVSSVTGELVDDNAGGIVSNYIPITPGVKIHAKGFKSGVGTGRQFSLALYKADKSYNTGTGKVYYSNMLSEGKLTLAEYDNSVYIVDTTNIHSISTVAYIRVCGIPSGSVDDIIVTVDEPII